MDIPVTYNFNYFGNCIEKKWITIINCNVANKSCFNCINDDVFCMPFIKGNSIYYQFEFIPPQINTLKDITEDSTLTDIDMFGITYGWNNGSLPDWYIDMWLDCDGSETHFTDLDIEYGIGVSAKGNVYGYFILDTSELTCKCFRFKIHYKDRTGTEIEFYTEQYCEEICEDILKLKGIYNSSDCFGYFYSQFGVNSFLQTNNNFINEFSVYGTLEKTGWDIKQEIVNNNKITQTETQSAYLFRTYPVPEIIADRIVSVLASKEFYINDERYYLSGKIDKNNEEGSYWIISVELRKYCDTIYFDCVDYSICSIFINSYCSVFI